MGILRFTLFGRRNRLLEGGWRGTWEGVYLRGG